MTREEFEKAHAFREAANCLVCGWISVTTEKPYKPGGLIWRCGFMQEQGVSDAEAVIDKPENYRCGNYK
jgi:hypothetical protein